MVFLRLDASSGSKLSVGKMVIHAGVLGPSIGAVGCYSISDNCFYCGRIFSVVQKELVEVLSIVLVDFSPPRSLLIAQPVEHHILQRQTGAHLVH